MGEQINQCHHAKECWLGDVCKSIRKCDGPLIPVTWNGSKNKEEKK